MPLAVRKVGGTTAASQTYTLGPNEAFRLDSSSFTIAWAAEDGYIIPTLTARDSGGFLIAQMQAPAASLTAPFLTGFSYTGPAPFADDFAIFSPGGYTGYLLHDFGSPGTTAHMLAAWDQPPGLDAASASSWLRSAGAVTMGSSLGGGTVRSSASITSKLFGNVPAGDYLFLHLTMRQDFQLRAETAPRPVVTDSVGGNVLDFHNATDFGNAVQSVAQPDGAFLNSCVLYYRIVNALPSGSTVTLTLPGGAARWLNLTMHDVSGLTVGNPIGPNPGGNYIGAGVGGGTSPLNYQGLSPVPTWVGGVFTNSSYAVGPLGTSAVQFSRGGVELETPFVDSGFGHAAYIQTDLPELHLGPSDTITASSENESGIRDADLISDFLIYGVDE